MQVYRFDRPQHLRTAVLALAAEPALSPQEISRRLYRQFGCSPAALVAELSPVQAAALRRELQRRGSTALLTLLFGEEQ